MLLEDDKNIKSCWKHI